MSDGSPIVLWPCGSPVPNDLWTPQLAYGLGLDYFRYLSDNSPFVSRGLNVAGDHISNGSPVVLWHTPSSMNNDIWHVVA